ncbi:MAG TPA: hypothetical protein VMV52_07630 [Candidatus Nanopelagicaceae bacterium]|nr:hypothetical protein [Candidatus Nanopelagicaceae bacterium]
MNSSVTVFPGRVDPQAWRLHGRRDRVGTDQRDAGHKRTLIDQVSKAFVTTRRPSTRSPARLTPTRRRAP